VKLPELPDKGDVSDFLQSHPVEDVIKAIQEASWWKPEVLSGSNSLFQTVSQFRENSPSHIDWLVEGVIQRGSNGLFISRPKAGKSYATVDLALALASGQKWLGFYVPKRVRVALVSREDNARLTQARLMKLSAHRNLTPDALDDYLYINAKGLKPKIMLDYEEDVVRLIADLKQQRSEFLILDVMRVLHTADENDNTEMQRVISVLNRIQDETSCSICLIHHDNKGKDATLTERARGASAIAGYAEFICGIRVVEEVEWTREFSCELKASMPPEKFYWRILDTPDDAISLEQVDYTPLSRGKNSNSSNVPWKHTEDDAD
jgi:RecA-family ATPase